MIAYSHGPDSSTIEENLAIALSVLNISPESERSAIESADSGFFYLTHIEAGDIAALRYATGQSPASVRRSMADGARLAAAGFGAGMVVSPDRYGVALGMAQTAGDGIAAQTIAALPQTVRHDPAVHMPEVFDMLAELHAALVLDAATVADSAAKVGACILPDSRRVEQDQLLAPLAVSIVAGDEHAFNAAVARHGQLYGSLWSKPSLRNMPEALLDIWGLGFMAIARSRGMAAPRSRSTWLPIELVGG